MVWWFDWGFGDKDWALLANVTDFQKAINERKDAIQIGAPDVLKVPGDDVQDHAFWNAMQTWVEDNLGSFVVSAELGAPFANEYYDNEDTIPYWANLHDLFAAAGLGTFDWRAYITHPDDAGVDQSRKIIAGDIIGPWIFNDLQKVISVLRWTKADVEWQAGPIYFGQADHKDTWAEAKTGAENDWADTGAVDIDPEANTQGEWNAFGGNQWRAAARRIASSLKITANIGTGCNRAVDWHANTEAQPVEGTFDAQGDAVVEGWCHWLTDSPAEAVAQPESSSRLGGDGSVFPPNWADQPPAPPDVTNRGYIQAGLPRCLVRWDIANGFEYK